MKRSSEDGEQGPAKKRTGVENVGGKIVQVRIRDLYRPDLNPLGGFDVEDLHTLFASAGPIEKIVCCSRPQTGPPLTHVDALVQYVSTGSASEVVASWSGASLTFDDHNNISDVRYSYHTELKVQNNNRCLDLTGSPGIVMAQPEAIAAAAEAAARTREKVGWPPYSATASDTILQQNDVGAVDVGETPLLIGGGSAFGTGAAVAPAGSVDAAGGDVIPGRVVVARITNLKQPSQGPLGGVTAQQVYELFSSLGPVLRIVCSSIPKSPPYTRVDAMVEFQALDAADTAIQLFTGQSLTDDGACKMVLERSPRPALTVKANNSRSWDYTLEPVEPIVSNVFAGWDVGQQWLPEEQPQPLQLSQEQPFQQPQWPLEQQVQQAPWPQEQVQQPVQQAVQHPVTQQPPLKAPRIIRPADRAAALAAQALERSAQAAAQPAVEEDRRVVVAHLSELYNPDLNPLAGLTLEVICEVFTAFGNVQKIVCSTRPKGPPLQTVDVMVQYASPVDAARCVADLQGHSITADGNNVAVMEYSRNRELVVKANNSRARDFTARAVFVDQVWAGAEAGTPSGSLGAPLGGVQKKADGAPTTGKLAGPPGPVVAAFITNLSRPDENPLGGLNVEDIHTVFSPMGSIRKIVCSTTPKGPPLSAVTALVQFTDIIEAKMAVQYLDNISVSGDGFNNMSLEFSARTELHVKSNNRRSWDYTIEPISVPPPNRGAPDHDVGGSELIEDPPVNSLPPLRAPGTF